MPENKNNAINGYLMPGTERSSSFEIRSGEVQEIMTRMPHWIIRQGTTVMVTVMIILFGAAYFIRFPDLVSMDVRISAKGASSSLPVDLAARVKPGQEALIEFSRYPSREFGLVEAVVESVAIGERDNSYTVKYRLVNGLVTTLHKRIPSEPQLFGSVKILTENKTVFERMIGK